MVPTNTDQTPFIYRYEDSQGNSHTSVPSNHTHSMSEVTDLPAIETTPTANSTNLVTSGGVAAALATKATPSDISTAIASKADTTTVNAALATKADKVSGATNNNFAALDGNGNLKDSGKKASDFANASHGHSSIEDGDSSVEVDDTTVDIIGKSYITLETGSVYSRKTASITPSNIENLQRAIANPDAYPTANSDKLVTSGGVAAALAEIEYSDLGDPIDLDTLFGDKSIIKKKVIGIRNIQLQDVSIQSRLYSEGGSYVEFANNIGDIPAEGIAIVTVYWMSSSYFVTLNGIFE